MQGGLAECKASRYSRKFLFELINVRNFSKASFTFALTWFQVRASRVTGAVAKAEMIEVRVEKFEMERHFYTGLAKALVRSVIAYIGDEDKVLDDRNPLLNILLVENHLRNPIRQTVRMQDQ